MTNTQKARDNSIQVQARVAVVGIDEKRVREIVDEKMLLALAHFTSEALDIAQERAGRLNDSLVKNLVEEHALNAFSDPGFQMLFIEAQKRAASTERESDYDLLSELMLHRFKNGQDRSIRIGVSRAVEIVDQIPDDALEALTIFHSVNTFVPGSGNMGNGLNLLDDLFGKIITDNLPKNLEWLDDLDVLDAIRISFGTTKLLEDFWYEQFQGYLMSGIRVDSSTHLEAKVILVDANLTEECLIENDFDGEYVKIGVVNRSGISKLSVSTDTTKRQLTDNEVDALCRVYDLYDQKKMEKKDFINEIEKRPNLKKLRAWWNALNEQSVKVTSVGKALAHSNVQRIDQGLPDIY